MTPLISVVVPTYERPDLLARCLAALAAQDLDPPRFEILVADDAASPATRRQVESFATEVAPDVRYFAGAARRGPAAARNRGWRAARGDLIAFTDDDCIPARSWLSTGIAALGGGTVAATGRVVVPLPDDPTDYERDAAGLERAEFVTANLFCLRSALEEVGGFDERFTSAWREDSDLQFALIQAGRRISRADGALVVHPVRPAPWGVSLRQQRKSRFEALLYKKWPALYRRRIRSGPPGEYYAIVVSLVLTALAAGAGHPQAAVAVAGIWAIMTGRFCARRLTGTSRGPAHLAEMVVTSALIPPLSVFWRLYGAWKYRVPFA